MPGADLRELRDWLNAHGTADRFRIETRRCYLSASDGEDFRDWQAGRPGPNMAMRAHWHAVLASEREQGIEHRRLRVFRPPLSKYEMYACAWGYQYNDRGSTGNQQLEDIRVLDLGEQPWLHGLTMLGDFWLANGTAAAAMHYDRNGTYTGFSEFTGTAVRPYREIAALAWQAGEPFSTWYGARPELRRAAARKVA